MKKIINFTIQKNIFTYAFIIFILIFSLFPLVWMLSTSFKPEIETTKLPPKYVPEHFTFENYTHVFKETMIPKFIFNTFFVAIMSAVGVLILGSLAAYGFSRYRFKGKQGLMFLLLSSVLISGALIIVPLYVLYIKFNLLNTYFGLIVIYIVQALPICTWLLKGHFDNIPKSLDESAMLDGCSRLKVLVTIILPLSKSGIIASFLYTIILVWREFIMAQTFITKNELKTLPVGVYQFFTELGIQWGQLSATIMISTIPMVVVFSLLQKYFNPGDIRSGIK